MAQLNFRYNPAPQPDGKEETIISGEAALRHLDRLAKSPGSEIITVELVFDFNDNGDDEGYVVHLPASRNKRAL